MRKIYLLLMLIMLCAVAKTQTTSAYAFATNSTGSLTDMTGATSLLGANQDDAASAVTNIGFTFWYMGSPYTQFSVNSNGYIRLGATAVAPGNYILGVASTPLITAFGTDGMTSSLSGSSAGSISYKLIGSAPNRTLVVQFRNMVIIYVSGSASADATYEVRLSEATGGIEFIYGNMARNSSSGYLGGMDPQYVGFSTSATAYATVTTSTDAVATSGAITSNQYTFGAAIPNLNSGADGSRKTYSFIAPAPTAPSGLTFTGVSSTGMTLNWTDNSSNEIGFAVYRSTDGTNYSFQTLTAANSTSLAVTGLAVSTNYFWKIYAVKEVASTELASSQATNAPGNIVATGSGLWSSTVPDAPWPGGILPTNGDLVTIASGATVSVDITTATAYSVTVDGTLNYIPGTASTLTIANDLTINPGGNVQSAATGTTITHSLAINGNIINNGTLDLSTNGNTAAVVLVFTGAGNNTWSGSGTNDIRTLTINKGSSSTSVLDVQVSNLSVQGTTADGTPMGFLTLTNGTLKLSGTFALTGRFFSSASYSIGATAGFWLNNPNVVVAAQNGSPALNGMLRMTQGIYNIGTASGNSMGFAGGSTVIVEGGNINAAGRFAVASATNTINYTQSGGTITVCTVGNTSSTLASFDLGTSLSSVVNISGGTIVCQLVASSFRDYRNDAGSGYAAITGGTLQLGNASSGAAKTFAIQGVMPDIVISNASANHTVNASTTTGNYTRGCRNITINPGTTLNCGSQAFLFNGLLLTNNGTLTHTGASSNFVIYRTDAMVNYTGNGVVTAPMTNLAIQATSGFTIDPASSSIVVSAVRLFAGSVFNSNKITVGNGGTTSATVQIGNSSTPTAAGSFQQQLNFNAGSGGTSIFYLRTTTSRTTGFELPVSRTLSAITFDDNDPTHSFTVAGGPISTGTLALTNGIVNTTATDMLTVTGTTTGSITRTAGYVAGPLARSLPASLASAATYLFPVGRAAYNPFELVNPTTNAGGTTVISAEQLDGPTGGTPGIAMQSINSNIFWNSAIVSGASNFIATTVRLTDAVTPGTSDAIGKSATQTGAYDYVGGTSIGTPTNTITSNSISSLGYFVLGKLIPPACPTSGAPVVSAVGPNTATITFTGAGSYILEYGPAGYTPGTGASAGAGGTLVDPAVSPVVLSGLAANTTFNVYVRAVCAGPIYSSNSAVVVFTTSPANDICSGAIAISCGGSITGNNTNAQADALAAVTCGSTTSTTGTNRGVWFTVTPAFSGSVTVSTCTGTQWDTYLRVYEGTCGSFTACAGSDDDGCSESTYGLSSVTFTGTAGTTYYILLGGYSNTDYGAYTISATCPVACATPAQPAISAITSGSATATWSGTGPFILEYGATGFTPGTGATAGTGGTVVDPATSPYVISSLSPATAYDVYVRRVCAGPLYSANTPVTTFTTAAAPPANDNASGAILLTTNAGCSGAPYTNVNATQGATEKFASCYQQNTTSGSTRATHTVWFKFVATSSAVRISTDISGGTLSDTHLGLFNVTDAADYNTFTIISCDDDNGTVTSTRSILYATGLVNGNTYYISVDGYNGGTGTFCVAVDDLNGSMVSTSASCSSVQAPSGSQTSYAGQVPIVDNNGNVVAIVTNPAGGSVSNYTASLNVNAGPVRSASGLYYLDRNYLINNSGVTNANVTFFYRNAELTNLSASDAAATASNIGVVRQGGSTCAANYSAANGSTMFLVQTSNGISTDGLVRWVQVTTPSFSNFYLQSSIAGVLPVGLMAFSGAREGAVNKLRWTTSSEQNCKGFQVMRSSDGVNYSAIGFVNTIAVNGNSARELNYSFVDNSPVDNRQYYRLTQVDIDGRSRLSNIVLIRGAKPTTLQVSGLFPNPAQSLVNVLVDAPNREKLTIAIMDARGKAMIQKPVNVEAGSNTIALDISTLSAGTYFVKLICTNNCDAAVGKFVKQ